MLATEANVSLVSGFLLNLLIIARFTQHSQSIRSVFHLLVPPSAFPLALKHFAPGFYGAHHDPILALFYSLNTIYLNFMTDFWLANKASIPTLYVIFVTGGIPNVWFGANLPLKDPWSHWGALILSHALWRHRTTFIPAAWPPALSLAAQLCFTAIGVLLPAAAQHYKRWRLAAADDNKSAYEPIFNPPPRLGPRLSYKIGGIDPPDLPPTAAGPMRLQLKSALEARLGQQVLLKLDIRRGCVLVRMGCFTRNEGGEGWTESTEGLPTVEEVRNTLPNEIRDRVTGIQTSLVSTEDGIHPDAFLRVASRSAALPLPPSLLKPAGRNASASMVPVDVSLTARWHSMQTSGSDRATKTAPLPSSSSICGSFAPVCWIGRRLDKLQVQGDPEWGLETDEEGHLIATCSFTVLVEPGSEEVIEKGVGATYVVAGLEMMKKSGNGTGSLLRPTFLVTVPMVSPPLLAELSGLASETQSGVLTDTACILELRTAVRLYDASSAAPVGQAIKDASDNLYKFATRRQAPLRRLAALATALAVPPPSAAGQPSEDSASFERQVVMAARRRHAFFSATIRCLACLFLYIADPPEFVNKKRVMASCVADLAVSVALVAYDGWMLRRVSTGWLKVLSTLQYSWLLLHFGQYNLGFLCAHVASKPSVGRYFWLRLVMTDMLMISIGAPGPAAASLASAIIGAEAERSYLWSPRCAPLIEADGWSRGPAFALGVSVVAAGGYGIAWALDAWARRSLRASAARARLKGRREPKRDDAEMAKAKEM